MNKNDKKIIEFAPKKHIFDNKIMKLTEEDIFNLLILYEHYEKGNYYIDLNIVMKSLGKYVNMKEFSSIYGNLTPIIDEDGNIIIDLKKVFEKRIQEKIIIENPIQKYEIVIIAENKYFDLLKQKYNKYTYLVFQYLMFYVDHDLEFGLDGWELLFEDEYISVPRYPGIVTGEFIGEEKNLDVLKKVKKRAIDNLKNINKKSIRN